MKTLLKFDSRILVLLMAVCIYSFGTAQTKIKVDRVKETMSKGNQPGYKVIIPDAGFAAIKDAWIMAVSKDFKTRVNESENEMMFKLCNDPNFIPIPFEVYSSLTQVDSSVQMISYFKIDTLFFDPATYPDAMNRDLINKKIEDYIVNFATVQYKAIIKGKIKKEEEKLKALEKTYTDLDTEQTNLEKSIANEEKSIAAMDEQIKVLTPQMEAQSSLAEQKRQGLSSITEKAALKAAEDELKNLDKDVKAKVKELEKINVEKSTIEGLISGTRNEIAQKEEKLKELSAQINAQKDVIKGLQSKIK